MFGALAFGILRWGIVGEWCQTSGGFGSREIENCMVENREWMLLQHLPSMLNVVILQHQQHFEDWKGSMFVSVSLLLTAYNIGHLSDKHLVNPMTKGYFLRPAMWLSSLCRRRWESELGTRKMYLYQMELHKNKTTNILIQNLSYIYIYIYIRIDIEDKFIHSDCAASDLHDPPIPRNQLVIVSIVRWYWSWDSKEGVAEGEERLVKVKKVNLYLHLLQICFIFTYIYIYIYEDVMICQD